MSKRTKSNLVVVASIWAAALFLGSVGLALSWTSVHAGDNAQGESYIESSLMRIEKSATAELYMDGTCRMEKATPTLFRLDCIQDPGFFTHCSVTAGDKDLWQAKVYCSGPIERTEVN